MNYDSGMSDDGTTRPTRGPSAHAAGLLAILAVAALLRIALATREPWTDEVWSFEIARRSFAEILSFHRLPWERNAPLFHLLLHAPLALAGSTVAVARAFSIVCSLGAVAILYRAGGGRAGDAARWAALLFALHPGSALYGMQIRMYPLAIFFLLAATQHLSRLAASAAATRIEWAAYGVLALGALGTHYFLGAALLGHLVWGYFRLPRRAFARQAGILAIVFLAGAAWILLAGRTHLTEPGPTSIRLPSLRPRILLLGPFEAAKAALLGPPFGTGGFSAAGFRPLDSAVILLVFGASGTLLFRARDAIRRDVEVSLHGATALAYGGIVFLLAGVGVLPFWYNYHLLPIFPSVYRVLAAGAQGCTPRFTAVVGLVFLLAFGIGNARLLRGESDPRGDMSEVAAHLRRVGSPEDEIWVSAWVHCADLALQLPERPLRGHPWDYDFETLRVQGPYADRPASDSDPIPSSRAAYIVLVRPLASTTPWLERIETRYGPPADRRIFSAGTELRTYRMNP